MAKSSKTQSRGTHQDSNESLPTTDQSTVLVNVELQYGEQEAEDAVHVLREGLLDVTSPLGGERLEGDYVLRQSQQDEHHQLCLCLLGDIFTVWLAIST